MEIGGLQKTSLIDYPGRISAIVFTRGCNFRCPYCHNPELVDPARYGPLLPEGEVLAFLEKRRGKLEAVSVTGGEPTLQRDLEGFLQKVKAMGFLTKVDTNGSNPEVIEGLIRRGRVDFLALDVKGPLPRYRQIAEAQVETADILKSIALMSASGVEHEFRTTVVRSQLDREALAETATLLKKGVYVLQKFTPVKCLDSRFLAESSYSPEEFSEIRREIETETLQVVLR